MTYNDRTFPHIFVVKSSAGAGKTYNLALRYINLLLPCNVSGSKTKTHISNIVAITFTNKAAQEMRSRIIDWMKRIILGLPFDNSSKGPMEELLAYYISEAKDEGAEYTKKTEEDIKQAIKENFEDLIRNFYDFNVSTIDSFVNLTLKASAFKLGLMPDFDISVDSASYIDIVLQECLQKILEDNAVQERFDRFLRNYIELEGEFVSWMPKDFLRDIISGFWREESKENAGFIYKDSISNIIHIKNLLEDEISQFAAAIKNTEGLRPEKKFLNTLEGFSIPNMSDIRISNYFLRKTFRESLNKGSIEPDTGYEKNWQYILELMSSFFEGVAGSRFSSYVDIYMLFKKMLSMEITRNRRLVLIEQLNALLQRILEKEHFIPEIYYALAERYAHFLIDEFQDTNQLQWKNVEILAAEALSRGGTLFLVGDKKQAIYRWRGGKSELVDEVVLKYGNYPVFESKLSENYRSDGYIVEFNNTVFDADNLMTLIGSVTRADSAENIKKIRETYNGSAQKFIKDKADQGYIRIEKMKEEGEFPWQEEENDNFSLLLKDQQLEIIKERFRQLMLQLKGRAAFRENDIAVLVRRKEEARFIVRALLENGFSVESEFTVNIKNNPLVKEMISFLNFINRPDNDLAFAGFLTGRIFRSKTSIAEGQIIQWIEHNRITDSSRYLYRVFQEDYRHIWDEYFEYFFKLAGYLPLYELVVHFLKRWGVMTACPEETPYFLRFCELIKEREGTEGSNLNKFLQFWNGNNGALSRDTGEGEKPFLLNTFEGTRAVKVMTIHRAKGLQFPVVILPFLKLNAFGVSDARDRAKYFVKEGDDMHLLYIKKEFIKYSNKLRNIYLEKEGEYLIDELNNMYVACTRAQKELYIFLGDSKRQKNYLIDYFFNLDSLQTYIHGNQLEMGRQTEKELSDRGADENAEGAKNPAFDDMKEDMGWMEKFGVKTVEVTGFFKEKLFAEKKGDVIHYILSLITTLPEGHEKLLDRCISAGIAKYGFQPHEDEIRKMTANIFMNPEFRRFFQPPEGSQIYTEREITDSHGNTYKIDRIIISEDFIYVIDFKTGEIHSADHVAQIAHYAGLVEKIHRGRPLRKFILYLDEGSVKEI